MNLRWLEWIFKGVYFPTLSDYYVITGSKNFEMQISFVTKLHLCISNLKTIPVTCNEEAQLNTKNWPGEEGNL